MNDLTILCVTNYGAHSAPFLSRHKAAAEEFGAKYVEFDGRAARVIEDVLDEAVAGCDDGWILRLDDDETCSVELASWLSLGEYRAEEHWAFKRLNLYPDERTYIANADLYPDLQTRLSSKALSGGRNVVHQGSPFGTGVVAPYPIEHHKFLVRPVDERRELLARYEAVEPGAGDRFRAFSVPEDLAELELVLRW